MARKLRSSKGMLFFDDSETRLASRPDEMSPLRPSLFKRAMEASRKPIRRTLKFLERLEQLSIYVGIVTVAFPLYLLTSVLDHEQYWLAYMTCRLTFYLLLATKCLLMGLGFLRFLNWLSARANGTV